MENKLQPSEPGALQGNSQAATFNLPGDGNTLVAHTDAVNNNYNVVLVSGSQPAGCGVDAGASLDFNPDYYNLIVVGNDDLDEPRHFLVRKDRALTESTAKELKEKYAALTPEAISIIKTFPAIIATENRQYGKTGSEHKAVYGIITDIKVQDNGIKIYYQVLNWVPQQKLNELTAELGIEGTTCFNELNRMHWAIKKVNMIEVLREAGLRVFSL